MVDLLAARGRGRRAYFEVAAVINLDFALGGVLQDVRIVHRVTSIGDALYALACIGVVATTGHRERLA